MSRARRAVSPETPNDCGLFEGEAFGLVDELVLAGRGVLGERALSDAEELVTDLEARDLRTDRHDRAHAGHHVQRAAADAYRMNTDQHFPIACVRHLDVAEVGTSADPYFS
jgi:hypothetical protein